MHQTPLGVFRCFAHGNWIVCLRSRPFLGSWSVAFLIWIIHWKPQVRGLKLTELQINTVLKIIAQFIMGSYNVPSPASCQKQEKQHCVISIHLSEGEIERYLLCYPFMREKGVHSIPWKVLDLSASRSWVLWVCVNPQDALAAKWSCATFSTKWDALNNPTLTLVVASAERDNSIWTTK